MPQPESKDDKTERLRIMIRDEVKAVVSDIYSSAVIPKGYMRCKQCGELIKQGKPCPYCEMNEANEQDDDDILDLL